MDYIPGTGSYLRRFELRARFPMRLTVCKIHHNFHPVHSWCPTRRVPWHFCLFGLPIRPHSANSVGVEKMPTSCNRLLDKNRNFQPTRNSTMALLTMFKKVSMRGWFLGHVYPTGAVLNPPKKQYLCWRSHPSTPLTVLTAR